MAADGTWVYTLNDSNAMVQALVADATLSDTFTVHTIDGTAQQIAITIHGQNDAAVVSGTVKGAVTEAGGVSNRTPGVATANAQLTDPHVDYSVNYFQAVNTATPSLHDALPI